MRVSVNQASGERVYPEADGTSHRVHFVHTLPFVLVALGVSALALLAVWTSLHGLIESFHDDAYYYFQIAWNISNGSGSTFDGLNPTNGYHPLWMAALVPIYRLVVDKYHALIAVKGLSAFLWICSVFLVYRISATLRSPLVFLPALAVMMYKWGFWFSGMESTITLPLLLAFVWLYLKGSANSSEYPGLSWTQGLLLALAVMGRLDLVFFVGIVGLVLLISPSRASLRSRLISASRRVIPSLLVVSAYMLFNSARFGTPMTVSGQAKSLGAPFLNLQVFKDFFSQVAISAPLLSNVKVGVMLPLVVVPAVSVLVWHAGGRGRILSWSSRNSSALAKILLALTLSNLAQLSYYSFFSSWPLWAWYNYYLPLILMLSLSVLADLAMVLLKPSPRVLMFASLVATILVAVKVHRGYSYILDHQSLRSSNYRTMSVEVAEELQSSMPECSVFAMGDRAGSLGYQLANHLVQTEGLVNSVSYLDALESGSVHQFLNDVGVDCIVYSGGGIGEDGTYGVEVEGELEPCRVLETPKFGQGPRFQTVVCDSDKIREWALDDEGSMGGIYTVWKYRAALNGSPELSDSM